MPISSDEQVMNAAGNQGDWTTDGFDAPQLNSSASATEIYREGGSCMEWVLKENIGVANGEAYTSVIPAAVDFTASLMKIFVAWFFTTSDADFGKLTNFRFGVSSDIGFETNYREWNVQSQVTTPDRYGWVPVRVFNQNPDFTGGTMVANSIDSVGWRCATGSLGTKLSGFDQIILISKVVGHSQTVTLQNLRDTDDTNDWGAIENYGPDFFKFNISIELGDGAGDTANTVFNITDKSIFFENIEPGHNLGFICVNPSSTNQLQFTLSGVGVTWNEQDSSVSQAQIFTNVQNCDIFRVSNSNFARGGRTTLSGYVSDADTFLTDCVFNACDRIDPGDFLFSRNAINNAEIGADEGAMLIDASFTSTVAARQTNNIFTRGTAGHALELASGTPANITLTGYTYSGYNATTGSNLTPNSGPADAAIYNNSGGAITITIAGGGDVPSVRNGPGATTTINAATQVTLTGLKDNTEVRVLDNVTAEFLDGIENATAGSPNDRSFSFSLSSGTVVDIAVFNIDWVLPPNNRIEDFTIPTSDASIPISQVRDRNYDPL